MKKRKDTFVATILIAFLVMSMGTVNAMTGIKTSRINMKGNATPTDSEQDNQTIEESGTEKYIEEDTQEVPTEKQKEEKTEKQTEQSTEQSTEDSGKKTTEDKTDNKSTETTTENTTEQNEQPTTQQNTTETRVVTVEGSVINAQELAQITEQYGKTLKEKKELQAKLNVLLKSQNSFIKKLNDLDDMIIDYQNKIDDIETKTKQIRENVTKLQDDLTVAQIKQDAQYELLKRHITQEYENGTYTYMDALFQAVDYMDIVNKTEYIQAVDSYNNKALGQLASQKQLLVDKQVLLESMVDDMSILEKAYIDEQDSLQILSDEKENQIKLYTASIDSAKSELSALAQLEAEQTAKIAQLEQSYNVSFTIGDMGNVGLKYDGKQFLWPCPSCNTIVSYYGPRVAPTAGASSYHRGIDIDCNMGSKVIAVAPGRVIHASYLGSAGNAVIIDHGSGISTCYFHLSAYATKVGEMVEAGDVIALSGSTGVSTGPHLHFAVRENGNYVNPLKYYSDVADNSKDPNSTQSPQ